MTTMIEVIANPYCAIDKDGVPQGTVASPGSPATHIGAHLDLVATMRLGRERFYFPGTPVKVPLTAEIARSVREGELLACSKKALRYCGVDESKFLAPDAALARESERAAEKLMLLHDGNDEAPSLQDVPSKPTERKPEDDMTPDARRVFSQQVKVETATTKAPGAGKSED